MIMEWGLHFAGSVEISETMSYSFNVDTIRILVQVLIHYFVLHEKGAL
jgi:hypothetical protein